MIGYEKLERAVKDQVITRFGIDETLCQQGDVDTLFDALQKTNALVGFLLEYGGGGKLRHAPFNGKSWLWVLNGYALVRFEGDTKKIEEDARKIVDQLLPLFNGSPTLGGLSALASITEIDMPVPSTVNDVPFYWIPFSIEIMEKI